MTHFWLRSEARSTERRTPITPETAKKLISEGFRITVEKSDNRIFPVKDYRKVGCTITESGSWVDAPKRTTIIGVKELPEKPDNLAHNFIHFAHLYKDQTGWENEITRFANGNGTLFDIEYLTNADNRRVAAFGYWAGWMGAALALWHYRAAAAERIGPADGVSDFSSQKQVMNEIFNLRPKPCRAIVIGAKGRSGQGAVTALRNAGAQVTEWDIEETQNIDTLALHAHDILVNCVLMTGPGLTLLTKDDLPNTELSVISDVSCDPFSDFNPLPIYDAPTSWDKPVISIGTNKNGASVDLTSIDNLPSLLPLEASEDFAQQILPSLLKYPDGTEWHTAEAAFESSKQKAGLSA